MQNIKETIMSQYANSPRILAIIDGINEAIDPQYFVDDFYNYVYRLSSAQGFGLDIWADRVGVSRNSPIANPDLLTFGFQPDFEPFNTYPFSDGGQFSSFSLSDSQLRELIIFKAASNILYATALNINNLLKNMFKGKRAYYNITGHMTARYVFEFKLSLFERLIVYTLDMLPKPSGVEISYIEIIEGEIFGFNGSGLNTLNNGVFFNG